MKHAIIIFTLLMTAVIWWATGVNKPAPAGEESAACPAAYPADFAARLARVPEISLKLNHPLPDNLIWQSGSEQPCIGHPDARKGGRVRVPNAGPFPAHFLRFGGSIQFFHQNLQAATEIPLVARHPLSGELTAGVAEAWATAGNTVYFRLNPAAHYNNGRPVRAADYLLAVLLQAENHCAEYEALKISATSICTHGEHLLSITFHTPQPVQTAAQLLHPAEPGFYREFDSRYRAEYAQRIPPATGPYRVNRVERGRMLELQRLPQWWGENLPLCRHRFNADFIEYHFLTSEAQVWEFFLRGKLDALQTRNIAAWQERLRSRPDLPTLVYDAEYPLPPYGIALNTRTLSNIELRRGLIQAMDMDKAVQLIMRGEGQRLTTFSSGYGKLSPANTPQYRYDPAAARHCFTRAGYTEPGSDGILKKKDGTRLSVRLLYTPSEKINTLVNTLVQSAAICGAEIEPEPVPWQICRQQLQERSHQLVFWAVPAPDTPAPALFLAPDADAESAPFALDSAEMNEALQQGDLARIDSLVYKLAIWLPGWKENRVYLVHQPRIKIPASPWCFDALDAHLFWVQPES